MTPHDNSRALFRDDSEPVPSAEYPAVARHALAAFYADQSPNEIDLENLTVQVEEFSWQNASYRLDLFFGQKPSFLPYNSDFVMAHRMWMRRSGEIVKSEPVYRSPNIAEGSSAAALPAGRRGFYPGNRAFLKELDFIGHSLGNARSIAEMKSSANDAPGFALDVSRGLLFLEEINAAVVERKESFRITIEWSDIVSRGAGAGAGYGPHTHIEFDVNKSDGTVSPFSTRRYVPPALC